MKRTPLLCVLLISALSSATAMGDASIGIEAVTYPSDDVILSFVSEGRVADIAVLVGQSVEFNQVLARQDDTAERAQLEHLKAQAEDTIRIRAAEATLAQKRVDLDKIRVAAQRGGATELEVRHAELDVTVAELSLEMAKFQQQQDVRKYHELLMHVNRMRIVSPFDGVVEKLFMQVGESADTLKEVMRVVRIDPLWIDVSVPRSIAERLDIGNSARIQLSAGQGDEVLGTVVHKAAVADAASNTLTVRVEMTNPTMRPAGEHVIVRFDD